MRRKVTIMARSSPGATDHAHAATPRHASLFIVKNFQCLSQDPALLHMAIALFVTSPLALRVSAFWQAQPR